MVLDNINLNLLKTFYNVAKEGSITKTAEKYFTSQPAISRSIKQLEEIFNAKLFYRSLQGVELTEKGSILYNSVEKIFETINQTEVKIKDVDTLLNGKLSIGIPSQIGSIYLFDKISKFHQYFPNIEITIVSKTTTELLNLLKKHKIDFIIDTSPVSTSLKNVLIKHICFLENCFFVSNKFPFNEFEKIRSLQDLTNYPLILPIPNTANRRALDENLNNLNVKLDNVMNIHTSEMIISAVKKDAGIGYALKDLIFEDINNGKLIELKINEELPQTEICIVYEKNTLSKVSNYFIENFLKICL